MLGHTANPDDQTSLVGAASQRHLLRRAATIGLSMRHTVNTGVAAIALATPDSGIRPSGHVVLIGLLVWSVYRLITRDEAAWLTAVDFAVVVGVCLSIPLLESNPEFFLTNSPPQAIAGTAVISFAVTVPLRVSLPMTVTIAAGYATGLSGVIGWERVASVLAVYYFGLQWATSALIRLMLLRVAATVDRAREAREAAQAERQVDQALRTFEREQLALLHDTAASTLLMVGQGVDLPSARLAGQARRDLDLLHAGPWCPASQRTELVGALRDTAIHTRTAIGMSGLESLWLDGDVGQAVVSSTREALNNVDRHARANRVLVEVGHDRVTVRDDGVGFDPGAVRRGHGIARSMTARMQRIGGSASVTSEPGEGTRVELHWPTTCVDAAVEAVAVDPDRLIERTRTIYGSAIAAYALANLITTVPYSVTHTGVSVQCALGIVAGLTTVLAVAALRGASWVPVWGCLGALFAVIVIQTLLLPPDQIGSQADWVQGGIGWCALPLILAMPVRRGAAILIACWLTGAFVELARHPSVDAWVNIGLGTGSILGVQLFALAFDGLMRDAARDVQADVESQKSMVIGARVTRAVAAEYRRRYATLVDNIIPLLRQLSDGSPVDATLQRHARAQSRQLRTLFDQSSSFEHPLTRRLRTAVDAAEARCIDVVVDAGGELPDVPDDVVDHLLTPLRTMLEAEIDSAHVVLASTSKTLSLSVVCRGARDPRALSVCLGGSAGAEVVTLDDTVWLVVEHRSGEQVDVGDRGE